jgi:hypothetical protein
LPEDPFSATFNAAGPDIKTIPEDDGVSAAKAPVSLILADTDVINKTVHPTRIIVSADEIIFFIFETNLLTQSPIICQSDRQLNFHFSKNA